MKLSIVIPAYNEEKNIGNTLQELQKILQKEEVPYEIIAVNDNSRDKTPDVIKSFMEKDERIKTVNRTPPGGFGRAIRSGLEVVTGEVVIIYMADMSDDPKDLIKYYRKIQEGYDCVFGTRFSKHSEVVQYPIIKLIVNRIVNKMVQIMFWTKYNDLTNAFKAYRTHVIKECGPFEASHFNITIEMSLSALIRKYAITQIPINWYGRTWGASNLHLGQMGRRYLSILLKLYSEKILIGDDLMAERLSHRIKYNADVTSIEDKVNQLEERISELEKKNK